MWGGSVDKTRSKPNPYLSPHTGNIFYIVVLDIVSSQICRPLQLVCGFELEKVHMDQQGCILNWRQVNS